MIKFLKKLNTNINLFTALSKKGKKLAEFVKGKKLLSAIILLIFIGIVFSLYQKYRPKSPDELYNLGKATIEDITQTVTASGVIRSETELKLKFQTSGQLAWVGVKEGDQVNKWQAIASLDTRALRKSLEQDLIDYSKERNDFEEGRLETYDPNKGEITDTIKRILQKNQWDLNRSVLDVELQNITLQYASLISPIDGIVTDIDVPVAGINITPTTAYFTIADPKNLVFEAEIDESDIGFVESSQSAELILDAYENESIKVTVDSVDFASSFDSSGSTVYIANLLLKNNGSTKYRLGMNGEVIITIAGKENALVVPVDALLESDDGTSLRVIENNKVVEKEVEVGLINENFVEILSGIEKDQIIAVSKKAKK